MVSASAVRKLIYSVPGVRFLYASSRNPSRGALVLYAKASGFRRGSAGRAILFYPEVPYSRYILWKALVLKNVKFHGKLGRPHDLAMLWEDSTFTRPEMAMALAHAGRRVINGDLLDIGKQRVATIFEQVFGYPLAVDPGSYQGLCVCKSDANATHDGQVIECPVDERKPGYVYQILVDNRHDDSLTVEYRLPAIGEEMPFVARLYRPIAARFSIFNARAELVAPSAVFSTQELERIKRFCKAFGCDLGELDILRDRNSGRIYVVDVNRTPYGPLRGLPFRESIRAMNAWADAFERQFLA